MNDYQKAIEILVDGKVDYKKIIADLVAQNPALFVQLATGSDEQKHDGEIVRDSLGIFYYNRDGKYHRENGPAAVYADGTKAWYINGEYHREDGPAVEFDDGYKAWFINGERHREDGPAIAWANGRKEWWVNGQELTEEQFNQWKKTKS